MLALSKIKPALSSFQLFHSDRGKTFAKQLLGKCIHAFNIQCSLSKKRCRHDNAVAEATFKEINTALVNGKGR